MFKDESFVVESLFPFTYSVQSERPSDLSIRYSLLNKSTVNGKFVFVAAHPKRKFLKCKDWYQKQFYWSDWQWPTLTNSSYETVCSVARSKHHKSGSSLANLGKIGIPQIMREQLSCEELADSELTTSQPLKVRQRFSQTPAGMIVN